ncbi:hypothetical protein PHYBLDRAFT_141731 [Phycomyces blakesleeanus NRRL 1555(-)]|uniref:Uncharacterized protein n=1 Tax=Phycomyces blakesleeanus (strain ATCC 8743b / DSM 1359 / FGSC 10004 / NBRC 33097 / NRRL 1555) TaxID=763407 RepID=A0A167PGG9_PHYB8|nr:hypothetical protein PHYBLDRAFT_141731 [Phycomyces blakesleeanus NRRL 1555(-)]OAD77866.1 hypothetical protein PHYBLDRAFT_141731 [Phycomyces blakesleeanus NRRL 1555(-)]|eukprot:XP_018295906.1 hypothetical protein PHYBLDRAFT_141731 [Phycomyces blakesleeanus NRRL 1555(-)]
MDLSSFINQLQADKRLTENIQKFLGADDNAFKSPGYLLYNYHIQTTDHFLEECSITL